MNAEEGQQEDDSGNLRDSIMAVMRSVPARIIGVEEINNSFVNEFVQLPKPLHTIYARDRFQFGWQNGSMDRFNIGAGIKNRSSKCYMIAMLQALFHVPSFASWIDNEVDVHCDFDNPDCTICAVAKLFRATQANTAPVRIKPFARLVQRLNAQFNNRNHQDAHEFFSFLMFQMIETYQERYHHLQYDELSLNTTPLQQLLFGYVRCVISCGFCNASSTKFEHFKELQLNVGETNSIEEAVQQYFAPEFVEYKCAVCNAVTVAERQLFLEREPIILCLQLKLFSSRRYKNRRTISNPNMLDVSPYMTCFCHLDEHEQQLHLRYRIMSAVHHIGTLNKGHYFTIARAANDSFFEFNDADVFDIDQDYINNETAYMLFYELHHDVVEEKIAEPLLQSYETELSVAADMDNTRRRSKRIMEQKMRYKKSTNSSKAKILKAANPKGLNNKTQLTSIITINFTVELEVKDLENDIDRKKANKTLRRQKLLCSINGIEHDKRTHNYQMMQKSMSKENLPKEATATHIEVHNQKENILDEPPEGCAVVKKTSNNQRKKLK